MRIDSRHFDTVVEEREAWSNRFGLNGSPFFVTKRDQEEIPNKLDNTLCITALENCKLPSTTRVHF